MAGPVVALYEPIDVLKPVADGIWIVDGPALALSALGIEVSFPTRMTIVRLDDGGLWCHSPIALSDPPGPAGRCSSRT
jgi:hypothetical protein